MSDTAVGLPDFLLARIAEDEAVARASVETPADWDATRVVWYRHDDGWTPSAHGEWSEGQALFDRYDPARVLAECDAKRRIVCDAQRTMHSDPLRQGDYWRGVQDTDEGYLRLLALPYADHPDYRPEWKP